MVNARKNRKIVRAPGEPRPELHARAVHGILLRAIENAAKVRGDGAKELQDAIADALEESSRFMTSRGIDHPMPGDY